MDDIVKILKEIGLPYAYHHFEKGKSPKPPFMLYLYPKSRNFSADGGVYHKKNEVDLELYTDTKNILLEDRVEEVLDRHKIFYQKSEVYIEKEKLYEVLYTFMT